MAQLVITLMFAALTIFAARAIMRELARPLHQPWLEDGFVAQEEGRAVAARPSTIDFGGRRNKARVATMLRSTRPQQPTLSAAA